MLFPATTLEQAVAASEKVCALVRGWAWGAKRPGLAVTISAGVAAARGQPTLEALLADADRKLYEAKRLGKTGWWRRGGLKKSNTLALLHGSLRRRKARSLL